MLRTLLISLHLHNLTRSAFGSSECEPIGIPMCQNIGYNFTRLPNQFNHETQEEAGLEVHQFWPLVKIECSPDLRFFLCSMYTPICIPTYAQPLPACRSVCERARLGCLPVMQKYGFEWPKRMSCERLPEYGSTELCMDQQAKGKGRPGVPGQESWTAPSRRPPPAPSSPQSPPSSSSSYSSSRSGCQCQTCGVGNPLVPLSPGDTRHNSSIKWSSSPNCASPCSSPFFSDRDRDFTELWLAVWSVLCCLSTLITFSTFLLNTRRFHYPERPIMFLSLCYLLISLGYLLRVSVGHQDVSCQRQRLASPTASATSPENRLIGRQGEPHWGKEVGSSDSLLCITVFALTYFFYTAASVWWVVLTATWFLSAGLKWAQESISRYSLWYHCLAWTLPMVQTVGVLMLRGVDGDPVSGLCQISHRDPALLGGLHLLPLLLYLILGVSFLSAGFISLFRIRSVIKEQEGRAKIDKLEKLMVKIGIFSVLYIVPAGTVIACSLYEAASLPGWERSLLCPDCSPRRTSPDFSVLMLKHFMILAVGITSGFWVWSGKTVDAWAAAINRVCGMRRTPYKVQEPPGGCRSNRVQERSNLPLPAPPQMPPARVESSLGSGVGNLYSTIPHAGAASRV